MLLTTLKNKMRNLAKKKIRFLWTVVLLHIVSYILTNKEGVKQSETDI